MDSIDFGLVLNLHQPAGNLDELLDRNAWEAKEILWALDRIPRSLWEHEDVGRVHVSLSGTLLETLSDPRFQDARVRDRRLRLAAVAPAEHPHDRGARQRLLPPGAAADPTRATARSRSLAGWASAATCSGAIGSAASGRRSSVSAWISCPRCRGQGYRWVIVDSEHVQTAHADELGGAALPAAPRARRRRGDRRRGPRPRPLERSRIRHGGRLVHRGGSRTHSALRLPAAGHDRHRRRQRRLVSQHHRRLELLERLLRGACGARARRAVGRYPAGLHQRLPRPVWRRRLGHGRPWCVEHGRSPRRGLRPMDRLEPRSATPSPGSRSSARPYMRRRRRGRRTTTAASRTLEQARWRVLRAETSCNFYWGEAWVAALPPRPRRRRRPP